MYNMDKQIVVVQKGNPDNVSYDSKTQKLVELEDNDYALTRTMFSLKDSIDALTIVLRNR